MSLFLDVIWLLGSKAQGLARAAGGSCEVPRAGKGQEPSNDDQEGREGCRGEHLLGEECLSAGGKGGLFLFQEPNERKFTRSLSPFPPVWKWAARTQSLNKRVKLKFSIYCLREGVPGLCHLFKGEEVLERGLRLLGWEISKSKVNQCPVPHSSAN